MFLGAAVTVRWVLMVTFQPLNLRIHRLGHINSQPIKSPNNFASFGQKLKTGVTSNIHTRTLDAHYSALLLAEANSRSLI